MATNLNQYSNIEAYYFSSSELLQISVEDFENICDDLFANAPIKFNARPNDEMDLLIAKFVVENNITIPIR